MNYSIVSTFERCCATPDIIEYDGNYVCRNCGLVHGPVLIMSEKRIFSHEDIENKKQNEPVKNYGARTIISNKNMSDFNGNNIDIKNRLKFAKLSKINNSFATTYERNMSIATPKLKSFCAKLGIPPSTTEESLYYYSKAVKKRLTMGKSIECLICACIYLAVRLRKLPRTIEEIAEVGEVSPKCVRRTYRMLLKNLSLPNMSPVDYKQYIIKFGNDLGIDLETQKRAIQIIQEAEKNSKIKLLGKDPKGFAAAALYIACKEANKAKSQAVLSEVAHVSEVTLRYRIRNLKNQG